MSQYQDDLDQLHARVDLLMAVSITQTAERAGIEGSREEMYDRLLEEGHGLHAVMVLTTEDPPYPEDHLSFRWFRVQDAKLKASSERKKLEGCDCARCVTQQV